MFMVHFNNIIEKDMDIVKKKGAFVISPYLSGLLHFRNPKFLVKI